MRMVLVANVTTLTSASSHPSPRRALARPWVKSTGRPFARLYAFPLVRRTETRRLALLLTGGIGNFAALFGISPEGLTPSVDQLKYTTKGGDAYSMAGLTAEQHAILQKLPWETVSKYPYAGIAKQNVKTPEDESEVLR